jgi:hypothetical protein
MKVIQKKIVTTLLILSGFLTLQAQSTEGTEFWLTFGRNNVAITPEYLQIRVVGGSQKTSVSIYFTKLNTYEYFVIEPYEAYDFVLNSNQMSAVYNTVMGKTNHSIHLTTSKPVSVYAFNFFPNTTYDVTNVLPAVVLGIEYYQISYPLSNSSFLDAYAVVATQDNTMFYHSGTPVTTLDKGDVYYRTSNNDMTGSYVYSTKPVAFFAVNQSTTIPNTTPGTSPLFQQLSPINTWDKTFYVPVSITEKNIVRIVASKDGTNITQTGGTIRTGVPGAQTSLTGLQAGEFVELDIHINDNGCFIETNNPVGVCSYFTNYGYSVPNSSPAQCWIPGTVQKKNSVMLAPFVPFTPPVPIPQTHYALIASPTDTKDNTKVSIGGGTPTNLSGGIWRDKGVVNWSFYNMPLVNQTESYSFTNPKGFIIMGYGIRTTGAGTYYYLAGSAMRDLEVAFYANDIHYQDLKDNYFCDGFVNFRAEIEGGHQTAPDRIRWFVDGTEEPGTLNQETWSKTFNPGTYALRMWVRYENDDTISKYGTLIIKNCSMETEFYANNVRDSLLKDTTFCNKSVNFRAEIEEVFSNWVSIKWYVDYGSGYEEEVSAINQKNWGKDFENGTFPIKMVVEFENDETATRIGTLKVQALWIKMRNVRY